MANVNVLTIVLLASGCAFVIWGPQLDARKRRLRSGDLPKPVLLRWPTTSRATGFFLLALALLKIWLFDRR